MVVLPLPLKPCYCIEPSVKSKKDKNMLKSIRFFLQQAGEKNHTHRDVADSKQGTILF